MTWWLWVIVWVVLVLAAAAVLVALAVGLFRRSRALLVEVGRAGKVASALSAEVSRLREPTEPEVVMAAVFSDPVQLRRERNQRRALRNRARRRGALRTRRTL